MFFVVVNMYIFSIIMSAVFNIVSLNVNGLRNQVKRRHIFDSCSSENIDILLLQETHASGYKEAREWGREFGGEGVWSFGTASSAGVAILFSKRHSWKLTDNLRDNRCRLVSVTITLPSTNTRLRTANCYAPNDARYRQSLFSEQLASHLGGQRHIVLGGDFNCFSDMVLDTKKGQKVIQGYGGPHNWEDRRKVRS